MKAMIWPLLLISMQVLAAPLPRPDHVVIVIEENKHYTQIIGNDDAPYINALAQRGMLFTRSHGVTHPSQPNYLALFTGSTHGITSDICPLDLRGDNLAGALTAKNLGFAIYSESLPAAGAEDCIYGGYRRKHNPVADWQELAAFSLPFTDFPQDFAKLPAVAWVVPDQRNDMHDGSIAQGDAWLEKNVEAYAQWALAHNSLLIVTWDEDNGSSDNRVATILVGGMVKRGKSAQHINHYSVLRTIEEMYGLPHMDRSAHARPITGVWISR
jgi:phosphatidylinositol-3-phosphatase